MSRGLMQGGLQLRVGERRREMFTRASFLIELLTGQNHKQGD